ncbi:MAG: DUF2062 domain-containing protein [Alphaproteobacteria bacterium]
MNLRHKAKNIISRIISFLWPKMGLIRFSKYLFIKLKRIPEKPHSIAAGFASGVFISFTPFVGFHLILSAVLAFILKGSIVASLLGTIVGNPWTFPFIWIGSYRLGLFIISLSNAATEVQSVSFIHLFQNFFGILIQLDWVRFKEEIMPIWYPMLIGSLPLAVLGWIGTYFPLKKMVKKYQNRRAMMRVKKRLWITKQKELKGKFQNIYKKIKRIIRKHSKARWNRGYTKRAYIRKITRKINLIRNKKRAYSRALTQKSFRGRLAVRVNQGLKNIDKKGRKRGCFKSDRRMKKQ